MNVDVYLFGELSTGYTQYPDDYASSIFKQFYAHAKSITQVAIRRDGNLMYYGYIRKLEESKYVGLCVVLNGLYINRVDGLFSLFENTISNMVAKGLLIHFNEQGEIVSDVKRLHVNKEEIDLLTESLRAGFDGLEEHAMSLPAISYSTSKDSVNDFTIDDTSAEIIESSIKNGYTFIYKSKGYNTAQLNSYKGVIARLSNEKSKLQDEKEELKKQVASLKVQQRNMKWVSVLGIAVAILFVVLWNKVLFPSEVTNFKTDEFVYYGPVENNKPNGIGVAVYPKDDKDGRKYYIGAFVNGVRQDSAAILYYQDGDYYYGSMNGDKWSKGILYLNSDKSHFEGSFKDNKPYDGTWYDHKKVYNLVNGIIVKK